jgi:hypothetical protein
MTLQRADMKLRTIFAIVGVLAVNGVYAQETFNFEGAVQYTSVKTDDYYSEQTTLVGVNYYFKPVVLDKSQPFLEIDFLQRASSVSFRTGILKYEDYALDRTSARPFVFSGKFYIDKFSMGFSNWSLESDFKLKSNTAHYYRIKEGTTRFNIGYFVTDNTVVSFERENDKTAWLPSANDLGSVDDRKITENGVSSHSVISLGGTQALVLDFGYKQIKYEQTTSQTNTEYGVKARYYPQPKFYFEGGYAKNTGDDAAEKGRVITFGAGIEVTPRFGLFLTTVKFNVSDPAEKTDYLSTQLTAGYRF